MIAQKLNRMEASMTRYQAYQGNQVNGAGPLGLILLTYDALYKSLGRARIGIINADYEYEGTQTGLALEALIELTTSLDMEAGGEIATHLAKLYAYMTNRLSGNICSGSTDAIDEVIRLTQTLHEGWKGLEEQSKASNQTVARENMAIAQPMIPTYAYGS